METLLTIGNTQLELDTYGRLFLSNDAYGYSILSTHKASSAKYSIDKDYSHYLYASVQSHMIPVTHTKIWTLIIELLPILHYARDDFSTLFTRTGKPRKTHSIAYVNNLLSTYAIKSLKK